MAPELSVCSDEMYKFNPSEGKRLKEFIARMYETNGRWVDPIVAEQDLARLNEMSKSFWSSTDPQYLGAGANSERLAHILRKQQEQAVQRIEGTGYLDIRKRLGAQMAIEKELSNRALVDLRKPESGFFDVITAPAVGDFLSGMLTLRPTQMIRGAAMYAAKNKLKARNDPNILMYKMWNKTRDLLEQRGEITPEATRRKPTPPLGLPEPAMQAGMQGQLGRGPSTLTEMYPQQPLQQGPPRLELPAPTQIQMYGPNTSWERVTTPVESPPKPYASLVPKPIGKLKAPEPNLILEYMKKVK